MIQTKEEMFLAEMGINAQATIEGDYTATYKLKDLLKKYAEQFNIANVVKSFTAEDVVNELKENETLDDAISYFDSLK